ncbi:MAG: ATP-binding protein [Lacunisphaera sp.]|nr:ATP-binding protein [Lacunisphaera sp.]
MKAWWQHRTLRFRLALWYSFGGTLLLAVFSATIYGFVAQRMAKPLNHALRQDLEKIQTKLLVLPDRRITWQGREVPAGTAWDAREPWFELWDEQGQLVRRCWPFNEDHLDRLPASPVRGSDTLSVFRIAPDIPLRVHSTPYRIPYPNGDWMIRVMRIHEPAADALSALLAIIVVSLPLTVALLVAGGYLITRHWLRPLELMVRQAEGITVDNLSQRLPVADEINELGRLATAFNSTLGRLEDSFQTLDRFVADASHELRTPLTTLRSVGEVGLRRSRTVEEYREIIGSMLEEAQRLHQLVERLLELASAEGGTRNVHSEPLRLDEFVTACVNEIGILAEYKNQHIEIVAKACTINTDPVLLRQVLQNLLDNAMKYSPIGATIRVQVESLAGECRVSVSDEGPGIPPDHLARLANRFYRVGDSRVRGPGGFGLGLAITKAYLRVLGGQLECVPSSPRGTCFSIILPELRDT